MWHVTVQGLKGHTLRYSLTALAVFLGVAFMAGTLVLTDTISRSFDSLYEGIYQSTTAVVRAEQGFDPSGTNFTSDRRQIDAGLLTTVSRVRGVEAVAPTVEGYAQLVAPNGKLVGNPSQGPPTLGEAWTDVKALNPLELQPGGRAPRHDDEIVIDRHSADVGHIEVGQRVTVLSQLPPRRYLVTGIVKWGAADSPLGASITAFTLATAQKALGQPGRVDAVNVQASPGVPAQQLLDRLRASIHTPGVEVVGGQAVTQQAQDSVHEALAFFDQLLLVFALVALFVGAFLIFNTFSIVVAQRTRELALLRAVGASRAQVMRSVMGEALVIGLAASVLGLGGGIALALLLKSGLQALGLDIPASGLVVAGRTVVISLLLGSAVTVASAVLPARRAAAIPPVEAMRANAAETAHGSPRRAEAGLAFTLAGAAALATGLFAGIAPLALVGGGGAALFVGLAMLGPLVARPVAGLLGTPLLRTGVPGMLARQNAMRNPARTSATAAALMVGVAVVSLMNVLASSAKASVNSTISSAVKADYIVSSGNTPGLANGFSPTLAQAIARLPQVSATTAVQGATAGVYGQTTVLFAADPAHIGDLFDLGVTEGSMDRMGRDAIAVSASVAKDHHLSLGSPVPVEFPTTGRQVFHVQAVYSQRDLAGDYLLSLAGANANFPRHLDYQIYARLAPGVAPEAGRQAISPLLTQYPNAKLMDQAQYKADQEASVDQLLNLVDGLLVLALFIALMGIANTLALSIYERTRELGLLRAVGMTKGQLRSSVRAEAVIVSVFGAIEGVLVGTLLGCAVVAALRPQGFTRLQVPVLTLLALVALSGVAGLVAARSPSRRAARLDVLQAITTE